MSKVKKVATLSFGQGVNIVVYFLFLPYMARVLSYEDYGTYGQVLLIASFATVIFSFGLSRIIYVYLNQEGRGKVLFSNLTAGFFSGFLAALLLFFAAGLLSSWLSNPSLAVPLKCYSLAILFVIPFSSINAYLIFKDKVRQSVTITVISNLIKILLVVFFIQVYASVSLALIGIAFAYLIQLLIGILYVRKDLVMSFSRQLIWEQIKRGVPLGLTGILGTGILYADGIMISKIIGVEAFAIYRNGAIEVPYLATIYASIAAIILPEVSKLYTSQQYTEIVALKKQVVMKTMMLTYPVLIFLLFNAEDLIVLYLGSKYEASAIIFAIFNLTLLIRVNDYSDILVASNKSKFIMYYYIMAFAVNILLNYFLIGVLGIIGAAISTVFSLFLLAFMQLRKSLKLVNSNIIDLLELRQIFMLLAVSISLAFVLDQILLAQADRLMRVVVSSIIYFILIYSILIKCDFLPKRLMFKVLPDKFSKLLQKWV